MRRWRQVLTRGSKTSLACQSSVCLRACFACIAMAYVVMANVVMAYTGMAYVLIAYMVMACIVITERWHARAR